MDNSGSFNGTNTRLSSAPALVLLAVAFLLPIFFVPSLIAPFQFTKTIIALLGVLVALFFFIIVRLREGDIIIPTHLVVLGGWLVALAYTASALFASENLALSFVGQRFEVDTVAFMVVMSLLLALIPLVIRTKERILSFYLVMLLSAALLALFQGVRLFGGPDVLSFDIFTTSTANILGRWNALGIFFGLTTILALMTIDGMPIGKGLKSAVGILLVMSLAMLAVVNFSPVWIAVGLFALGMFVHGFMKRRSSRSGSGVQEMADLGVMPQRVPNHVSFSALLILLVAIAFVVQGDSLGNYVASVFNISQVEARPSWTTTLSIAGETYKSSPIFGSGPNTFPEQWWAFRPDAVNATPFWNVNFESGVGMIPTSFVTTGILGALSWGAFFLLFLYAGFRHLILRPAEEQIAYHLSLAAFTAALYLWIMLIIYISSAVLLTLAFLFTGLFLATLRFGPDRFKEKHISLTDNPRLGFIAILGFTVLLIAVVLGIYGIGQRYVSALYFQQSVLNLSLENDIDAASRNLDRAVLLGSVDLYHRFATQVGIARLNEIVGETEGTVEERRNVFQQVLTTTVRNGQIATELNPREYQNWMALGRVYQGVIPLGIEGAHDQARSAYERAQTLAPNNPAIEQALAEIAILNNDEAVAREHLNKALELKSDYTAAIFALSQLQIQAGEVAAAIQSVEAAAVLVPNNPVLFFQLGLLRFNNGDNQGALPALERAVELNSNYANARYFLGLVYAEVDRVNEAIEQFEVVAELNPTNQEVRDILANLRAGRSPFGDAGVSEIEELPIEGE
jgi:cytochrome c-type biogenesis protein CcmH/NrfG